MTVLKKLLRYVSDCVGTRDDYFFNKLGTRGAAHFCLAANLRLLELSLRAY